MSRASVTLYPKNALGVVCHRSVTRELLATRATKNYRVGAYLVDGSFSAFLY